MCRRVSIGWELRVVGAEGDEEFIFPGGDSMERRVLQGPG